MTNRSTKAVLAFGVSAVLLFGWAGSSALKSTASAADVRTAGVMAASSAIVAAGSTNEPGCGCSGHSYKDVPPEALTGPVPGEDPIENARMHRMSANLLKPQMALSVDAAAKQRSQWVDRFRNERNPLLREEIITEMVQLDDAKTLDAMLALFDGESHTGVRDQIILIVGYLHATNQALPKVCERFASAYERGTDHAERGRMLDILSNIPASESVAFVRSGFLSPRSSVEDRLNAAAGLFKLSPRVKVDAAFSDGVTDWLKQTARAAASTQDRAAAARTLAAPGQSNKPFFRTLLASEEDAALRQFLALAVEEFPTH